MVVGLGNPGPEYENTRHNAGFMVLDTLAERIDRFSGWKRDGDALRAEGRTRGRDLSLLKPQTYMNRSGVVVRGLLREGVAAVEILVVCDDVYLPLGRLRLRSEGGTGGHQGLASIVEETGALAFPRLRIGVGPGPKSEDLADYVLEPFTAEERRKLPMVLDAAASATHDAIVDGIDAAMNRWNRFTIESDQPRGEE